MAAKATIAVVAVIMVMSGCQQGTETQKAPGSTVTNFLKKAPNNKNPTRTVRWVLEFQILIHRLLCLLWVCCAVTSRLRPSQPTRGRTRYQDGGWEAHIVCACGAHA
jgi:hypothetical protein